MVKLYFSNGKYYPYSEQNLNIDYSKGYQPYEMLFRNDIEEGYKLNEQGQPRNPLLVRGDDGEYTPLSREDIKKVYGYRDPKTGKYDFIYDGQVQGIANYDFKNLPGVRVWSISNDNNGGYKVSDQYGSTFQVGSNGNKVNTSKLSDAIKNPTSTTSVNNNKILPQTTYKYDEGPSDLFLKWLIDRSNNAGLKISPRNNEGTKILYNDNDINAIATELENNYKRFVGKGFNKVSPQEYSHIAKALMAIPHLESKAGKSWWFKIKRETSPDVMNLIKSGFRPRGQEGKSQGVFQQKIEANANRPKYYTALYQTLGIIDNNLSEAGKNIAYDPRKATRAALARMVEDTIRLRDYNLINKYGEPIDLTNMLIFDWHYGNKNPNNYGVNPDRDKYVKKGNDYIQNYYFQTK